MKCLVALLILAGFEVAPAQLSPKDAQAKGDLLLSLVPDERHEYIAKMAPTEREAVRKWAKINYPKDHAYSILHRGVLVELDDEDTLKREIAGFVAGNHEMYLVFADANNPHIIEMFIPFLFKDEAITNQRPLPMWWTAMLLIVYILRDASQFSPEVHAWARDVNCYSRKMESQTLVRQWWLANRDAFRKKDYAAVKPGPVKPAEATGTEPGNQSVQK